MDDLSKCTKMNNGARLLLELGGITSVQARILEEVLETTHDFIEGNIDEVDIDYLESIYDEVSDIHDLYEGY